MLAVDEPTLALPLAGRYPADRGRTRGTGPEQPKRPCWGAAVYHCYRYEPGTDPVPVYADGTTPTALPADARGWRLSPWRHYEHSTEFDSRAATAWLKTQLSSAVVGSGGYSDAVARWIGAVAAECAAALDTLAQAYHTQVALPDGSTLVLAVVAIWDPAAIHPLLPVEGW